MCMFGAGIPRKVHDHFPVFLERLPREDLSVQVCGIDVARDVVHIYQAGSAQLPHFVHAAVDVLGVLGHGEPMAKIVSGLAVGVHVDRAFDGQANELAHVDQVDELYGEFCERVELGFA